MRNVACKTLVFLFVIVFACVLKLEAATLVVPGAGVPAARTYSLGGYPYECRESLGLDMNEYILLLAICTHNEIYVGDAGSANFFIKNRI